VNTPEVVLAVIRSDRPLSALRSAGKLDAVTIRPTLADLTSGFNKHAGRRSLRKWALLILHASFIELEPEANSPEWDSILGSIWDAAGVP
jgi:hypothetical protein